MKNCIRQIIMVCGVLLLVTLLGGCQTGNGGRKDGPIVHPTEDQIDNAPGGTAAHDEPYTPWWAQQN